MDKHTEAALFWFCVIGVIAEVAYLAGIVAKLIIVTAEMVVGMYIS